MNSKMDNFTHDKNNEDEEYIIPLRLLKVKITVVVIQTRKKL